MRYAFLGMAIQALVVAGLTKLGLIEPTPLQQFLAGCMFLVLAGVGFFVSSKRRNPNPNP